MCYKSSTTASISIGAFFYISFVQKRSAQQYRMVVLPVNPIFNDDCCISLKN